MITEHAVHQLGLQTITAGWLIQTPHPPTAAQISNARLAAAAAGLTLETRSSAPASSEIITWATVFGIALALVGAVLGTLAAYLGAIAYSSDNHLDGLSELANIPVESLLFILVGMPLIAAAAGWLLAGREPAALGHQPME